MTTHGGARRGAGRPGTPIDERRVMHLYDAGMSQNAIAERFGVSRYVINRVIRNALEGK